MAESKPKAPIRRFDVFAEYNRIKAVKEDHLTAAKAKGYGLWVAKVVAAQKFGRLPRPTREERAKAKAKTPEEKEKEKQAWHELGGVVQTDKLFDKEIVNRMGKDFYTKVFRSAVDEAYAEGKKYVEIRDAIRKNWKPEGSK
jgi:hypothetical protein